MADPQFAVVFKGELINGADPAQVRANLAKLFKADAERIEAMFTGKPVVIKKGVDEDTANNYVAVLAKAGASAKVVEMRAKTENAPPQAAVEKPAVPPESTTAKPAATADQAAPSAPSPDEQSTQAPPQPLDTSMAEPGVILVEPEHVEAPNIDTAHLDMAEVGVTLVEYQHVDEPEFDLSAFTLDAPGTTLVEPEKITPPDYDLSELSLDEN